MKRPTIGERAAATTGDARWARVVGRDATADGTFYYSVKSTGVYCRPSCAARLPRPENVRFHASCDAAERAGFRPCQRCRPRGSSPAQRNARRMAAACRLIERAAAETPSLATLAAHAGLSPYHFHRIFKAVTGVTPRDYAAAHRARRVRASLARSGTVTNALYDAGFNSSSRFYETSAGLLGMTPTQFRAGGAETGIFFALGECSLGSILVAQSARGVCAILIGDDPVPLVRDLRERFPKATLIGDAPGYQDQVAKVVALVEAPSAGLDLPLDIRGTAFQQRVWKALRRVPPGSTATYAAIARRIGAPNAARAVARACAANPLAVAIPCHRVVRGDGAPAGYRWGARRKQALLEREGAIR